MSHSFPSSFVMFTWNCCYRCYSRSIWDFSQNCFPIFRQFVSLRCSSFQLCIFDSFPVSILFYYNLVFFFTLILIQHFHSIRKYICVGICMIFPFRNFLFLFTSIRLVVDSVVSFVISPIVTVAIAVFVLPPNIYFSFIHLWVNFILSLCVFFPKLAYVILFTNCNKDKDFKVVETEIHTHIYTHIIVYILYTHVLL